MWTNRRSGISLFADDDEDTDVDVRHEYQLTTNEVEAFYVPGQTPPPTPTPTPTPTPPMPTPPPTATPRPDGILPKTGDESNPALWLALLSMSLLVLGGTAVVSFRKGKKEQPVAPEK